MEIASSRPSSALVASLDMSLGESLFILVMYLKEI